MVKLFGKATFVKTTITAVTLMSLAACAGDKGGTVYERATSPDGKLEAVLMLCGMASDKNVLLLTGAVFEAKGKGCGDLIEAVTSFEASRAPEGEGPAASVIWEGDKAVFELLGDRTIASRYAKAEAPLDMIQLKGSFDEADIVTED